MKKIKIIDLLNMIASKEYDNLPKKIKYINKIFEYARTFKGTCYQYYDKDYQDWKGFQEEVLLEEHLTDEVEIIEIAPKIKKEILDKAEKKYLKTLIRPFRNRVTSIQKRENTLKGFIAISIENDATIYLPNFANKTMYLNMEAYKDYTLEELGL